MSIVRSAAVLAGVVALLGGAPAGAAPKKKPKRADLVVSQVKLGASTAPAGGTLSLRTTVRNAGRARARASVLRAVLARSARRRGVLTLGGGRTVARLRPRARSAGRATFTVPATVPQGVYFVFACADADRKVREAKEGNNCRAAAQRLTVIAPLVAPVVPGGDGPAGSQPGPGGDAGPPAGGGGGDGGDPGGGDPGGGDPGGGGDPDPPPNPDRDGDGTPNELDCAPDDPTRHPGAPDRPDGDLVDSNCDGKDGDAAAAVHVRSGSPDADTCGTPQAPCGSIAHGLARATTTGRDQLYLGPGTYPGGIRLNVPVSIYGGWDADWTRTLATRPTVNGIADMLIVVRTEAVGLLVEAPAEVADINVVAPNATGTSAGSGKSSYGALVRNVASGSVALRRMNVTAGNGTNGLDGADIGDPSFPVPIESYNGRPGQNAGLSTEGTDPTCNEEFSAGGAGGTPPVGGFQPGAGGRGGREDRDCALATPNFVPEDGLPGGTGSGPGGGTGGPGGPAGWPANRAGYPNFPNARSCGPGQPGQPGAVVDGTSGAGAGAGGQVDNPQRLWAGRTGGHGALGQNGGTGGGGGGAGACELEDGAIHGAGGGGGGVGGARNAGSGGFGGRGGAGGGGSFALYVIDSAVTLDGLLLTRGNGGTGGAGGDGGRGGLPGFGGAGGAGWAGVPLTAGGRGGDGGRGGHTGAGGGGAGGSTAGIYLATATSTVTGGPSSSVTGGTPGAPGPGGAGDAPVPGAPAGTPGTAAFQLQCATPAAC